MLRQEPPFALVTWQDTAGAQHEARVPAPTGRVEVAPVGARAVPITYAANAATTTAGSHPLAGAAMGLGYGLSVLAIPIGLAICVMSSAAGKRYKGTWAALLILIPGGASLVFAIVDSNPASRRGLRAAVITGAGLSLATAIVFAVAHTGGTA